MSANINPETGIAYGVLSINEVDGDFLERFYNEGRDLRFAEFMEEIENQLDISVLKSTIKDFLSDDEEKELFGELDCVIERIKDRISDRYENDSTLIELVNETESYLLSENYIIVIKSPFVAVCRPCSPCFPNAGDLGSITRRDGGMVAYCLSPDEMRVPEGEEFEQDEYDVDATIVSLKGGDE